MNRSALAAAALEVVIAKFLDKLGFGLDRSNDVL